MNAKTASVIDTGFMKAALDLARTALSGGEFPVGCVIATTDRVVASGQRSGTTGGTENEIDHAEINALRALWGDMPHVEYSGLTVYCTMEPCLMCFAAIVVSGIKRIVYAYEDVMGGATQCDRSSWPPLYRDAQLTVIPGVLRKNSLALFQRFFANAGNPYWADSLLSRYTLDQPGVP
jgi:tRNA(adenine34) deaminase